MIKKISIIIIACFSVISISSANIKIINKKTNIVSILATKFNNAVNNIGHININSRIDNNVVANRLEKEHITLKASDVYQILRMIYKQKRTIRSFKELFAYTLKIKKYVPGLDPTTSDKLLRHIIYPQTIFKDLSNKRVNSH